MTAEQTVYIVDDDDAFRESLCAMVESTGQSVKAYSGAQEYLDDYDASRSGCLVLDLRMRGMSGAEMQALLNERNIRIPIIMLTGHGDIDMAVRVMKAGAVDFIRKPYDPVVLQERIREALALDARNREEAAVRAEVEERLERLTPREREVLHLLAAGKYPKAIAYNLGISRKTVDVHRGHIMKKLEADSLADIVRMVGIYRDGVTQTAS